MDERDSVLRLSEVERCFVQGSSRVEVLRGVNLSVYTGEIVALLGPSGAGKSTLLHIAGLLETPDGGTVSICAHTTHKMSDDQRTILRRRHIGFVYQQHHLLPEFSALENVLVPQILAQVPPAKARQRAQELLNTLGLSDRQSHRPAELSGGEQQRVAIARALANTPSLLLADEPTGNLDEDTADIVFGEIVSLARDLGVGALIATHNNGLARRMDRTISLDHGRIRPGAPHTSSSPSHQET